MSYQQAQRRDLSKKEPLFSGGYVDNASNVDIAPFFSPYLRNCRLDGSSIVTRPGHILFAQLFDVGFPQGIGSYLRTNSADDRLVVRHTQGSGCDLVVIDEDGTVTETDSFSLSDGRMFFQNIADVMYCMNGIDDFGKLVGTTYTTPSTGISNFSPSFSVVFNGSHWASGWSDNPNKVYKSVADDYEDFSSTGSDILSFGENITGLSATAQALFYFTKNTISVTGPNDIQDTAGTITYTTRTLQTTEGATNNSCIVEVGTNVYYVSSSNAINMIAQGSNIYGYEVLELSDRKYSGIRNIMKSLDKDQSDAFGYFLPGEMLIKRFFKSNGATFNDVCIVYDIIKDKFLVDSQKYFYDGVFFKGRNYTVSMLEAKVYRDEESQTDEDASIPFEYRTKEFFEGDPTFNKILRESRTLMDINELTECVQEIWIDGALADTKTVNKDIMTSLFSGGIGTYAIGEEPIGEEGSGGGNGEGVEEEIILMRTKGNLNKKFRKIQRRWRNSSVAGKVRLKSLTAKIEGLPAEDTKLTE